MIDSNGVAARKSVAVIAIVVVGLIVYLNSFDNGFHFDDEHSILENPHIRDLGNIPRFFIDVGTFSGLDEAKMYRPLLVLSFAVNYALGGYEVFGYHVVNLLLHICNALLLWLLACRLGVTSVAALSAALCFVAHPLGTEPVNYISSRSSLMAAFFFFSATAFLASTEMRRVSWMASICICYLGGLASKAVAVSFALVACVYLWGRGRFRYWLLAATLAAVTVFYIWGTRDIVTKAVFHPVRPLVVQVTTQLKALAFYLWKIVMPVAQSVEPQFLAAEGWSDFPVLFPLLMLVSLLIVAFRMGWQHRLTLPSVWFIAALMPSSLIPLNVLVNEHRLYLSLAAFALVVGLFYSGSRLAVRRIFLLCLMTMMVLSVLRNRVWKDEETLWKDAVDKGPAMSRPYVNLGKALIEKGRFEEAIVQSRLALEINARLPRAYYNVGWAHHNLQNDEFAIAHYQRAIELDPRMIEAYNNLGNLYQEQGRPEKAFHVYRQALEVKPIRQVYHNLGNAFLLHGQADSARTNFERAIELEPDGDSAIESYKGLAKALRNGERHQTALEVLFEAQSRWSRERSFRLLEGSVYAAMGDDPAAARALAGAGLDTVQVRLSLGDRARKRRDWERALGHYQFALDAGARDARVFNARGEVRFAMGDPEGALDDFRTAGRTDPKLSVVFANIGRVQVSRGRGVEAASALERALELEPNSTKTLALLAKAYAISGKFPEAIDAYSRALALDPESAEIYKNLGVIYEQMSRWRQAEEMYQKSLAIDEGFVSALHHLGTFYLRLGKLVKAIEFLEEAVRADANHEEAQINLAAAYTEAGDLDEAIEAYERFLILHGGDDELGRRITDQLDKLKASSRATGG